LLDDVGGVALAECVLLRYAFEELSPIAKSEAIKYGWDLLCDEEIPLVVLEELVELEDVGVVH